MKILLVDLNNLVARTTNAFAEAQTPDGFPIGGMFGSIKMIRDFLANDPHDAVIGAIDWGRPAFRTEVCPEYKAQREGERTEEEEKFYQRYKQQIPVMWEVFNPCGMATARAKNWEGDDVIASLALYRFKKHHCTVYSSDRDFLGIIDGERVKFYDIHHRTYRDPDWFVTLKRCLDPKVSDNLDGVPGIGEKTADKLIENWVRDEDNPPPLKQSMLADAFIAWCKTRPKLTKTGKPTAEQKCVVEQQKIRANWKCTYLRPHIAQVDSEMKFRRPAYDKAALKAVCEKYNLVPLIEDFSAIYPVFSRLTPAV